MKYLIVSFDDNTTHDRKAVELLNKYNIKGTFFINSGTLNSPGYLAKEELDTLFIGHEIASHTVNHPNLKELTHQGIKYQILEDIENLKVYSKQDVKGFAYPFKHNKKVKDMVKECGVLYARTEKGTKKFDRPTDFLEWNPTMHFTGLAWDANDFERLEKGFKFMLDKLEDFLEDYNSELLHIWMHSWEFKDNKDHWDMLERFFRLVSNEDELESVTCIEYYQKVS